MYYVSFYLLSLFSVLLQWFKKYYLCSAPPFLPLEEQTVNQLISLTFPSWFSVVTVSQVSVINYVQDVSELWLGSEHYQVYCSLRQSKAGMWSAWLRSPAFLVPHSPSHFPTMNRSAIKALRPGGLLVYSTCTLSKAENQDVISEILTSNSTVVPVDISGLARTCSQDFTFAPTNQKCSLLVIPEKGKAWGPMFIAKLKKIVSTGKWWHSFVSHIDVLLYAYDLSTLCVST